MPFASSSIPRAIPFHEYLMRLGAPGVLRKAMNWVRLRSRREVPIFYDPNYRLPLPAIEANVGIEPRRADYVVWYLLETRAILPSDLRAPQRVTYADLARVHSPAYLESLSRRENLSSIFTVDAAEIPIDETLNTVRLACGGTIDAARLALQRKGPVVNLLGGFHHAAPTKGGGLCPFNDMAVAIAVLRAEGFSGRIAIVDLDAHPPDGTAACFRGDPTVWIGSLSGSQWLDLEGVDETLLPGNCGDDKYLRALAAMLERMPKPELAFVMAGGDVLAGDRMGRLGLTLDGARRRELKVAEALEGVPTVWLPGGGYHRDAWKIHAGVVLALSWRTLKPVPETFDPMTARYRRIWRAFEQERLGGGELELTAEDVEGALHVRAPEHDTVLGFYTADGLEFALHKIGILGHLQRLGFSRFRVDVDHVGTGDRMRLFGDYGGQHHVLAEGVLEKRRVADSDVLFVHWFTLRNPRAQFSPLRPQLPGQEKPGLGLARESGEFLAQLARGLGWKGVIYRPAWYHMAYTARYHLQFVDPVRQGRFEAMLRDLGGVPLREATLAFAEGRVLMNGQPYKWEPEEMAWWLDGRKVDRTLVDEERARVYFAIEDAGVRGA